MIAKKTSVWAIHSGELNVGRIVSMACNRIQPTTAYPDAIFVILVRLILSHSIACHLKINEPITTCFKMTFSADFVQN
ncbi:MAG: hypothetical protein HN493_06525 [Gammaproteobacteria bacterium]|jgi:hypothetical protein|nr:hypothetical protein [Gammaproteobacteria bacterium]